MNADGSGQTRLTNNLASDSEPAWSPDGSTIAFVQDGSIMTVDLQGKTTKLTNGKNNDSSPAWNPIPPPS